MFASTNNPSYLTLLLFLSILTCTTYSQAQQQAVVPDQSQTEEAGEDRRIERLGEVSADEWEMNLAVPSSAAAEAQDQAQRPLPDEAQNRELQRLLSRLAEDPGSTAVLKQLDALLANALSDANKLMDAGEHPRAEQILQVLQSVDPGLGGLGAAQQRLQSLGAVPGLLQAGDEALEAGNILQPENDNAHYYFRQVLDKEPANPAALVGLAEVQQALLTQALAAARELDFELADSRLQQAAGVRAERDGIARASAEIDEIKQEYAKDLEQKAVSAMDSGHFNQADISIIDLIALGGQQQRVDELRTRLKEARLYGGLKPGQAIRDELGLSGHQAPELIIIPAGSFRMGSRGHSEHEEPRHRVTLSQGFAMGVREVTVGEFQLFIDSTGYRTTAENTGHSSIYNETAGRLSNRDNINWRHDYRGKKAHPDMPVLHVSLHDANAYVQWLSRETGKAYRLPSEAEFEYVASAGTKNSFWWGEGTPVAVVENLTGERDTSPSGRQWTVHFEKYDDGHWGPAPAGSTSTGELPHPMGVFDIIGNVSEWVEDCWHDNYVKAPVDGSAWVNRGCNRRVVRGGYWASAPEQSRAAVRIPVSPDKYGPVIGFRVARDL